MNAPLERNLIRFSKWTPVRRDGVIGYSYTNPRDGRRVRLGSDRWMRAKSRIAASALATGAETFDVYGGLGRLRWRRVVTVTEAESVDFFETAISSGAFMLRGLYRKALATRDRRNARGEFLAPVRKTR
jgi:hypothetical protein